MNQNVFESIFGYAEIKQELSRIIDQLQNPDRYAALGVTQTHGVLLYGSPGVGKSTLAKCFVDACGRNSFICRKDKANGGFVEEIVRIFREAEEAAPSVILLDDVDKFASNDRRRRDTDEFVTLQTCIDRVKDLPVFVIATANDLEKLPDSLIRAGRFDHVLQLNPPRGKDAEAIVAFYLSKKPFMSNIDVTRIARLMEGRSCAELESTVNQAAIYAAFEGRQQVEMKDMVKAILRQVFEAPESFTQDMRTLPLIACHEAGHALVAELLEPDSVQLVTVLNHDACAAGVTSISRDERYFHSKQLMEHRIMMLLAGKAATEICHGVVDPGAGSDLRRAFAIAERFVSGYCAFGFDQHVHIADPSDELRNRRDVRIAAEMERYYSQTRQLLLAHRDKLELLIARLVEEKTLLGDRVQEILLCA